MAMKSMLMVVALCGVAAAAPGGWPVQVPDGWTEEAALAKPQVTQLSAMPQTKHIEATIFMSPDRDAQLTLMKWELELPHTTKASVDAFDGGMAKGAAEHVTMHVEDSRQMVGDQMHGTSTDVINGLKVHYERIYGVDKDNVIHMVSAICTAKEGAMAPCEAIQRTLSLQVANASTMSADDDPDSPFQILVAAGIVAAVLVVVWATRRFRR